KMILVTGHRRESFWLGFLQICQGLAEKGHTHPEGEIVYPGYLNAKVERQRGGEGKRGRPGGGIRGGRVFLKKKKMNIKTMRVFLVTKTKTFSHSKKSHNSLSKLDAQVSRNSTETVTKHRELYNIRYDAR
ncbi:hypothetical protein CGQ20_28345, partial [Klebsiella pneumoniae]